MHACMMHAYRIHSGEVTHSQGAYRTMYKLDKIDKEKGRLVEGGREAGEEDGLKESKVTGCKVDDGEATIELLSE